MAYIHCISVYAINMPIAVSATMYYSVFSTTIFLLTLEYAFSRAPINWYVHACSMGSKHIINTVAKPLRGYIRKFVIPWPNLYYCRRGMIVCRLCNMGLTTALSLLVSSYYIFNIEYPFWSRNIFWLVELLKFACIYIIICTHQQRLLNL